MGMHSNAGGSPGFHVEQVGLLLRNFCRFWPKMKSDFLYTRARGHFFWNFPPKKSKSLKFLEFFKKSKMSKTDVFSEPPQNS